MAKKQAVDTQDTPASGVEGTSAGEAASVNQGPGNALVADTPTDLKVLAYFPEHSDGANFHALQAVASLSQLGVTARVVHGSVFNEANQPVSRLVVELPETVAA